MHILMYVHVYDVHDNVSHTCAGEYVCLTLSIAQVVSCLE